MMHDQLLGTGKCLNGSVFVYLCEAGCFGEFSAGPYEAVLQQILRAAFRMFRAWCWQHKLKVVQPRFTPARVHRKSRTTFACLSSKAIAGKTVLFWHAEVAGTWAMRAGASLTHQVVCSEQYPMVMTSRQGQLLHNDGLLRLQSYAWLRSASAAIRRGQNKNLWLMLPKHHHFLHKLLRTAAAERLNPYCYSLMTAESFVGLIAKSCRSVTLRGLQRYLCSLNLRLPELPRT